MADGERRKKGSGRRCQATTLMGAIWLAGWGCGANSPHRGTPVEDSGYHFPDLSIQGRPPGDAAPPGLGDAATAADAREGGMPADGEGVDGLAVDVAVMPVRPRPTQGEAEAGCRSYAGHACQRLQTCNPRALALAYGDLATCALRQQLACVIDLTAPGAQTDPGDLEVCAGELDLTSCQAVLDEGALSRCFAAGARAVGLPCAVAAQCTSGRCGSQGGGAGGCSTCLDRIGEGAACPGGDVCHDGLVCSGGRCVRPGTLAMSCREVTQPCLPSLTCRSGVCQTPLTSLGATCQDRDCALFLGLRCDPDGTTCVSVPLTAPNAPCSDQAPLCQGSSSCQFVDTGVQRCIPPVADQGDCSDVDTCLPPATCWKGICRTPDPIVCQ